MSRIFSAIVGAFAAAVIGLSSMGTAMAAPAVRLSAPASSDVQTVQYSSQDQSPDWKRNKKRSDGYQQPRNQFRQPDAQFGQSRERHRPRDRYQRQYDRPGYWNGHRGYRDYRKGYRRHTDGYFYPPNFFRN